ncbi:MAG: DUF5067 domain-containing protein [Lachnospiraceae bacterium]|nr:DUF5067 domain-containing protein [Lachnospiraceae bacterium]MCI7595768.1 DUF5067 domain-containing protein [Lachnospiraceae bacterium]MDD7050423.1 DUF5067 domain-containing protein [Lachnospiraceae bacterium]MDY3221892.1 DUF5067 domain-containing protein [Lachnospiraceae bacterium]MDY4096013.1 DUF5067 domain-containing protein [Lachnospiraceae bacterium]
MKKKKLLVAAIICSFGLTMAGCGGQELTLSLTEEEQKLVSGYAASVLMKYNVGSNMRVLSGEELTQAEIAEQAQKEKEARRQQLAEEYRNAEQVSQTTSSMNTSGSQSGTGETIAAIEDLGNFMALEDFSITYQNYEVTDSYGQMDDGLMMAMDATAGNKLLVAHFSVTNNTGEVRELDILSMGGRFRLTVDGKTLQSQYTLLLNDLSMYKGQIEAGVTMDMVLVFEISQEQEAAESMELIVNLNGQKGSIVLK